MSLDALGEALGLAERGEPFAIATVVWRRSPSSGQVGARAVITPDGRIQGWLSGACAEPAVISEAMKAMAEGAPRLVFLGPPEELAGHQRDGVISVPIACQSEGALEVYVEPILPKPHVVAIGRSPVVDALAGMARALGWRATIVDAEGVAAKNDGGSASDHSGGEGVVTALDMEAAGATGGALVVVATQGHYDEEALERALGTDAAYIGLVASRKRAEGVLSYLRDRGLPPDQLARISAPAGLDLGHLPTAEIAAAVLAELVQLRAAGAIRTGVQPPPTSAFHEALDPICGMTVKVATARYRATHEGMTVYFCSAGCRERFLQEIAAGPDGGG